MSDVIFQRKWLRGLLLVVVLTTLIGGVSVYWDRRGPQTPTEIFEGITYGRERLEPSEEGSGFIDWVRIDLTAPGIELYVTPLDPSAVAQGWQYRLRRIGDVMSREHLAVAINGTMFTSNSGRWLRMSGDPARSVQSVVADHVVSHVLDPTYLLWFDDLLTPHLRPSKPPTAVELAQAKWGIGGQARMVVGRSGLARKRPQPRFAHGGGGRSAAQAFVLGGWRIHLATSSAEEIS